MQLSHKQSLMKPIGTVNVTTSGDNNMLTIWYRTEAQTYNSANKEMLKNSLPTEFQNLTFYFIKYVQCDEVKNKNKNKSNVCPKEWR